MVQSAAPTVPQYLAELPPERRAVVTRVRSLVRRHLPSGYVESMQYGMIVWGVPLSRFAQTYNGQPLSYVALAAQKNNYALYLMCAYQNAAEAKALADAYRAAGKRLDMGKSCLRFRRLEDLLEDAIGRAVASTSVEALIEAHEAAHGPRRKGSAAATTTKPANAKKAANAKRPAATKKVANPKTAGATKATTARRHPTATKRSATKKVANAKTAGARASGR